MNRESLALQAVREALRIRQRLGLSATSPVCVFDAAKALGIETWFVDAPSLEGMYVKGPPAAIFVGTRRSTGRRAMTCAHEIGHHVFQHGSQVDEYVASNKVDSRTPEEFLANTFAANFLMTRGAVAQGLLARGIPLDHATPEQVYCLAGWLGVSYSALLYHMRSALKLMRRDVADNLLKVEPKDIRAGIGHRFGLNEVAGEIIVADGAWVDRPIDAQVGDVVCVPVGSSFDDVCGTINGRIVTFTTPGIGRVYNKALRWSAFLRVSRRQFAGLASYRHLEEADDDSADSPGVSASTRLDRQAQHSVLQDDAV